MPAPELSDRPLGFNDKLYREIYRRAHTLIRTYDTQLLTIGQFLFEGSPDSGSLWIFEQRPSSDLTRYGRVMVFGANSEGVVQHRGLADIVRLKRVLDALKRYTILDDLANV